MTSARPTLPAQAAAIKAEFESAQKSAGKLTKKPMMRDLPKYWNHYYGGLHKPEFEVETGSRPKN